MKALRYISICAAALVGLAVLAAGIVLLAFDPNRYKAELIRIVHEKTGRTLAIDGQIGLAFFPRIGVAVDKLALSGPGGVGEFVRIGQAKVAVALLPLLTAKIVADHADLSDVDIELVKRKDGTTNFDDLVGRDGQRAPAKAPGQTDEPVASLALEIEEIRVGNANIVWRDEADVRSVLKNLHANGSVRIGTLVAGDFKAQNIHVGVRAAGGRIELSPFNASLYQGMLAGSASVNANTNQFSLREQFTAIAIGPLLHDAAGFDRIEGRGNVALNVTTTGTTVAAWQRALDGSVRIDIRDGAVKGVNLGEVVKAAGSLFGAKSPVEGRAKVTDQTEFSDLSGSFAIRHGVAHNDDLAGRSPLLKLAGAGTIDLGAERIDYLVKATPVGALSIGGGRTLTVLQGVAVPVRIAGPLAAPEYSVDMAQLVVEVAKSGAKLSLG